MVQAVADGGPSAYFPYRADCAGTSNESLLNAPFQSRAFGVCYIEGVELRVAQSRCGTAPSQAAMLSILLSILRSNQADLGRFSRWDRLGRLGAKAFSFMQVAGNKRARE
jgi:hypothetical protein